MELRIYSDIHLEHRRSKMGLADPQWFVIPTSEEDLNRVLILAGDIDTKFRIRDMAEEYADKFKAVLYVLGNHDYWGKYSLDEYHKAESSIHNVHLLQCNTVVIDYVAFSGATLWSGMLKGNPLVMNSVQQSMNDYHKIRKLDEKGVYRRLTTEDTLREYLTHCEFFKEQAYAHRHVDTHVGISHHAPSFKALYANHRQMSNIAWGWYSDTDEIVAQYDYWIHGHTHDSGIFLVDETPVISNQIGYPGGHENFTHQPFNTIFGEWV